VTRTTTVSRAGAFEESTLSRPQQRSTENQRPRARDCSRHRGRRAPHLEALEDRCVPAITYHGGELISNVEAETLYLGDTWSYSNDIGLPNYLNRFTDNITHSQFLDQLSEYSTSSWPPIGRGALTGTAIDPIHLQQDQVITDATIQTELNNEISAGSLHSPDLERLYVVYTPDNVHVVAGNIDSRVNATGYHSLFVRFGVLVYYAVVFAQTGNLGLTGYSESQQFTLASGQQLADAITDPYTGFGWFDPSQQHGEISDPTNDYADFSSLDGYSLPKLWSNQANGGQLLQNVDKSTLTTLTPSLSEEFSVGRDQTVYKQLFDAAGNAISPQTQVSTQQVLEIKVAEWSGGPEVFATGLDSAVYYQRFDQAGGAVDPLFLQVDPGKVRTLEEGQNADGTPILGAIGLNDQVYAHKFLSDGRPTGVYSAVAPGDQVETLTMGQNKANGTVEAFVIGLNRVVYYQKFDAAGNPIFLHFQLTAGGQVEALAAGNNSDGSPELVVIGLNLQVYDLKFTVNGDPIGTYNFTRRGAVKSLAAGSDGQGDLEVFVIQTDDQVYNLKFDSNGDPASDYMLVGAGPMKKLAVGQTASGTPELFTIDPNDQAFDMLFDGNGDPISPYQSLGSVLINEIS
jgi:hypothetical protein